MRGFSNVVEGSRTEHLAKMNEKKWIIIQNVK